MDTRKAAKFALPVLLLLIVLVLPRPDGLTYEGQAMFGVLVFAAAVFILQPIPLGLAGIVVLILPLLLGATTVRSTFQSFGNSAVFFLIGAFIIASSIERTDLHRWVSLVFLKAMGSSPRLMVLGTMISGALLSFIMPEHGVIILIVPVLTYTLLGMGIVPLKSNLAKGMMIGAAYGCTIGSLGTPLGGARNPLTIAFLRLEGIEVDFLRWMTLSLPIVILSLLAVWLVLILVFPPERANVERARSVIVDELKQIPSPGWRKKLIIAVLALIIAMFIFLPQLIDVELSIIALLGAVMIFIAGGMRWKDVEERIPWGIILLYGGAISMGIHLADSGAALWLADKVIILTSGSALLSILLMIILTKILTEFMSNTAAVSILLPIGFAVFIASGLPPEMGSMLVGLSGGLAFMFLFSTPGNLISYSSGYFRPRDMLKAGIIANVVTVAIILVVVYTYWKWIGVW